MTVPAREDIMKALFALLKQAQGFTTYSRKMAFPQDVKSANMPCLIMYEGNETNTNPVGDAPPVNKIHVHAIIYAANPPKTKWSPDDPCGASLLNPLLDAVEAALSPDPVTARIDLGGLVYRVLFDDEQTTIKDVGDTDANGFGIAIIPIRIELYP